MNKLLSFLLVALSLNCLISVECTLLSNDQPMLRLAKYIVKYFNLEKLETETSFTNGYARANSSHHNKCDDINTIEDYFFEVYSSELGTKAQFTLSDIEDLIYYHSNKKRKPYNEINQQNFKCERKNVMITKILMK